MDRDCHHFCEKWPSLISAGIEGGRATTGAESMCEVAQQDVAGHCETLVRSSFLALTGANAADCCPCRFSLRHLCEGRSVLGICATWHSRSLSHRLRNTNLQLMLSATSTAALREWSARCVTLQFLGLLQSKRRLVSRVSVNICGWLPITFSNAGPAGEKSWQLLSCIGGSMSVLFLWSSTSPAKTIHVVAQRSLPLAATQHPVVCMYL